MSGSNLPSSDMVTLIRDGLRLMFALIFLAVGFTAGFGVAKVTGETHACDCDHDHSPRPQPMPTPYVPTPRPYFPYGHGSVGSKSDSPATGYTSSQPIGSKPPASNSSAKK